VSTFDPQGKPAVLLLDDGSIVELPGLTAGEAAELVRMAQCLDEAIGGHLDPHRVQAVSSYEPAGES
jgi:diadenosine tetraphosphate (Ap4A) HIT family hydrolase